VIDRRTFLAAAVTGGLLAKSAAARAQQAGRVHRIGFLSLQSGLTSTTEAFHQGLRELGYVEGRNLIIEYRWAARRKNVCRSWRRNSCSSGGGHRHGGRPTIEAARRATSTIPIVMARSPILWAAVWSPASPARAAMSQA